MHQLNITNKGYVGQLMFIKDEQESASQLKESDFQFSNA